MEISFLEHSTLRVKVVFQKNLRSIFVFFFAKYFSLFTKSDSHKQATALRWKESNQELCVYLRIWMKVNE